VIGRFFHKTGKAIVPLTVREILAGSDRAELASRNTRSQL
jgi:hypothetical protein